MPVSIEQARDIWTIINDRPEARNAMDRDSARAIHDAFLGFDASETSVAVFFRGSLGASRAWRIGAVTS